MSQFLRSADFRQNMFAFTFGPHQAKPHLFERRNLWRADVSSTIAARASRPSSSTFRRSLRFPQQLPSKAFRTRFSNLSIPELSHGSLSNFVPRSLGTWGVEFLRGESIRTLSSSDIPFQITEVSNLYAFLSHILAGVTPIDVLSYTFVSAVFGIMGAYIVHELKDHVDSPSKELVDHNGQRSPRIGNSSSTLRTDVVRETADVWLNLSKSSSFFRSVSARCPSLSSATAYRYIQKLEFNKPEFQRQCLPALDGGAVALDWPSHLDIEGSKELENIMLLVCGTTEGSQEDGILKFSQLVEQHGYFPIVFNPRGCGGSPLTTPRVFSAADSDDVRLAVQFITKSRPWATFLGIGWGLGANILARYLGEEGSYTPLTAAVCIDNPFDLSSVTRPISGSRWVEFNHSMSKGLVQILDVSKMLFQGDKRGFDVSGALAATSVREFDEAISRVVHGYTTLEDFYVHNSSGKTLEGVRIPLLCILHLEDYTRTQASIPHQVFKSNAYTMFLVASPSDSKDDHPGAASEWTHAISLEWLAAVEISMLKGRHPDLREFSPTVKLQRDRSYLENQLSGESLETIDNQVNTTVPVPTSDISYRKEVGVKAVDKELKNLDPSHLEKEESIEKSSSPSNASHGEGAKASEISEGFAESHEAEHQLPEDGLTEAEEAERGQVVQVAETVMNVLDVTMPGTLADVQKQQVLKAVGRGETLVTALEEAVPEEVRGKISASVSEVVHAQGLSLTLAGSQGPAPMLPTGVTDGIQGKLLEWTGVAPESDVSTRSENRNSGDNGMSKTPENDDTTKERPRGSVDGSLDERKETFSVGSPDLTRHSENPTDQIDGGGSRQGHSSVSKRKDTAKDMINQADSEEINGRSVTQKNAKMPKDGESKGEITAPPGNDDLQTSQNDLPQVSGAAPAGSGDLQTSQIDPPKVSGTAPPGSDDLQTPQNDPPKVSGTPPGNDDLQTLQIDPPQVSDASRSSQPPGLQMPQRDPTSSEGPDSVSPALGSQPRASTDVPADTSQVSQSDRPTSEIAGEAPDSQPPSSTSQSDPQQVETTTTPPSSPPENSSPAPAVPTPQNPPPQSPPVPLPSVGEALQALTGFDDSTQMAVTNVFGVVENVLDQLEKDNASPQADTTMSGGNLLNDATSELTKSLRQNINKTEDEDRNHQGNSEKQSKEVGLVPKNQQEGSHFQSLAERRETRNEFNSRGAPVEGEGMYPESRFCRIPAVSRGVEPSLSKNRRGYIMDASGQQTEPGCHEAQDKTQNSQPARFESSSNHDCPAEDMVDNGAFANGANQKRLEVMAAEVEAECEETAESSPSGLAAADNGASGVQENDSSVADLVMNALKLEVLRRLGSAGLKGLGVDLEKEVVNVAHAVSEAAMIGKNKLLGVTSQESGGAQGFEANLGGKLGVLNGNSIVTALGSVLGSNSLLGRLLPFGVLVGVVMAALGATYLIVADDQEEEAVQTKRSSSQITRDTDSSSWGRVGSASANYSREPDESSEEVGDALAGSGPDGADYAQYGISSEEGEEQWNEIDVVNGSASVGCSDIEQESTEQTTDSKPPPDQGKLMGAMAAAMGATAAVASSATNTTEGHSGDSERYEGSEQKLVPVIAEKAISIVSPVIPKTEAGDLDHERLVAVLTEVGQKGGPLTLVGKVALLWGGLRGAMSLADRLLTFYKIKERPLHERLLGFGGMAVLLWTPVLVPLLPTLLQQWATKSPSGVADAAAEIGLYGAVFILVTIWGRRVRGYDRPLVSYGLQLFSKPKLRRFAGGLAIGFGMVSGFYTINWLLGYSQFTWDAIVVRNPDFPGALASSILTSWKVLMLVTQCLTKAVAVALVEEVLFRAWLQEEIAADLGYHWAVILSAFAFAVVHWSPTTVAGLWFFGVALSGARARMNGDLSLAIAIHAGIVTAFSVMTLGGLVSYIPEAPAWITGGYPGNPWAGALATGMIASLAIALYPRQQQGQEEI